jgi:hypothetical protein
MKSLGPGSGNTVIEVEVRDLTVFESLAVEFQEMGVFCIAPVVVSNNG